MGTTRQSVLAAWYRSGIEGASPWGVGRAIVSSDTSAIQSATLARGPGSRAIIHASTGTSGRHVV